MSRSETNEAKAIPFNSILVDEEINSRTNMKGIKDLAENIKSNGLLSALLVANGGASEKHPYTLIAGFRRAAALKELSWGSKPVNVIVVDDVAANLIENVQRENLHPFDQAARIRDMVAGEYPVPAGMEAKKWDKKDLGAAIGMSVQNISNYIRVAEGLTGEVRKLLRSREVPFRFLLVLVAMTAKEKDEDGKITEVPDDKKQLAAAKEWIKEQEQLEAQGRKKKPRKSNGGEEGEGGSGKPTPKKVASVRGCYEWLVETGEVKGKDAEIVTAQIDTIRFLTGELKKAPGLDAKTFKRYEDYLAEENAVEETDEEEEASE